MAIKTKKKTIGVPSSHSGTSHVHTSQATLPTTGPPATPDLRVHTPHSKLAKTDLPTAIAFITTVRPYVEPYVEPLLWRGVSWVLGDAERPGDAVREVERWKEQQSERERTVMQGLGPYIYHERQEPGSMMCGQHALNSMLQGNYFTPPDLAQIAHEIDQLEQGVRDSRGGRSTNMDDTGYFSVQVLENALKNAFGLTLVRWRSEEMRPYQAVPDTQLGFILNLEQHWFTLRRFGHPKRKGHWFNLNSFLQSPEWVGSTYLGMVLQQAEKEGYSVFVVRPLDPSNPEHTLPETEADLLAETLDVGDFEGQVQRISTTRSQPTPSSSNAIEVASSSATTGFENEDIELQRALQASISAGYGGGSIYEFPEEAATTSSAPAPRSSSLGLGYGGDTSRSSGPPSRRTPVPVADDPPTPQFNESDPVAASAARGRLRLEQMQREQAAAMQGLGGGYETVDLDPAAATRRREAQDRVRRAREEEEEQIRRAMEESLRSHDQNASDEDLSQYDTPPTGGFGVAGSRNYDDEDAQLQAALKASLDTHAASGAPPVSVAPSNAPAPVASPAPRAREPAPSGSSSVPAPRTALAHAAPATKPAEESEDEDDDDDDDNEDEDEETPASKSQEVEGKAEVADPDELRRRRLARFGG